MEDAQIVELYLHRDESAIHYTGEKYGVRLRGLALGMVRDPVRRRSVKMTPTGKRGVLYHPMNQETISMPIWPESPAIWH